MIGRVDASAPGHAKPEQRGADGVGVRHNDVVPPVLGNWDGQAEASVTSAAAVVVVAAGQGGEQGAGRAVSEHSTAGM